MNRWLLAIDLSVFTEIIIISWQALIEGTRLTDSAHYALKKQDDPADWEAMYDLYKNIRIIVL